MAVASRASRGHCASFSAFLPPGVSTGGIHPIGVLKQREGEDKTTH